ncbi:MAG: hypothetical protein RSB04_03245 [Gordonibacter sp.]|uniref:YcjF family protein n=1 Tax=Gordonibacter sp. TaxID=1968902 RepID=UPI002FC6346A
MQLPVDVKAVIDEATNIDDARKTPLSVSVYIDDTAPGDSVARVRSAFASASPTARVSLLYLDGRPFAPFEGDDMAVIVAGLCPDVGSYVGQLHAVGVPVMVATTMPALVAQIADAQGHPIPEADIVAPESPARASHALPARTGGKAVSAEEPYLLDERAATSLDRRMGEWVVEACRPKRLAFALAFPFVRRPLSVDAVNATSVQNAGIGLVMFIPGADLPIMTLNQAKMLLQIAAAYGEPMSAERVKELAAVVGGAFALRTVARQVVAIIPALGWAIKAAIGYSGTQAMGRAAIEYFEGGGNIAGLANVVVRARDKAVELAEETRECMTGGEGAPMPAVAPSAGGRFAGAARTAASKVKGAARTAADAAVPFASSVVQAGAQAAGVDAGTVAKTTARSVFDAARGHLKSSRPTAR